jgi:hypothetical protein
MDDPSRAPIVVIETAETAVPLHEYTFPAGGVDIVVGSEAGGVHRRLLTKLRKGFDAIGESQGRSGDGVSQSGWDVETPPSEACIFGDVVFCWFGS